jgi:hypothetical protein
VIGKVYVASFDVHDEILEYEPTTGAARVMSRSVFERTGAARTFGAFMREGDRVLGVLATPDGPLVFADRTRIVARFGEVSGEARADGPGRQRFELGVRGLPVIAFEYAARGVIGANPYDATPEDVDMGAMLAAALRREGFFRNHTRAWI